MPYVYPDANGCSVHYDLEFFPEEEKHKLVFFEEIPPGSGKMLLDEEGRIYYEPFPEPPVVEGDSGSTEPLKPTYEEIQSQILLNTELLIIYKELGL